MLPILTARSRYRVFRNRVLVSEHATEREAVCEAIRHKQHHPKAVVHVDHDLQIDVDIEQAADDQ